MDATRRDDLTHLFNSIGIDRDYSGLDLESLGVDLQGWGSTHPVFAEVIDEVRPSVVIEVGTWKGGSLLHMWTLARAAGCNTVFIAVDTWLGGAEHWLDREDRALLGLVGGYPTVYRQFIANVTARGAASDVFALPLSSTAAARVLEELGVVADVVYIDASHDLDDVSADLRNYWRLLRAGGLMFGDDYHPSWPGVVESVDAFCARHRLSQELADGRWLVRRPS